MHIAYVDPSVMTYTVQALAGVAVAVSAVAGVAWRRARKRVMGALDIDENAGKVVEPVVHRVDPETGAVQGNACDQVIQDQSGEPRTPQQLSWKSRFLFALVVSLFTVGTLFVVSPLELVAGNVSDLVWGLPVVAPIMVTFSLVVALVLALLLSALRGKAFDVAFGVVAAIGVACVMEALLLNAALPSADGEELYLPDFPLETMASAIVWAAIVVGAIAALWKMPRIARLASAALCGLLLVAQLAGLGVTVALSGSQSDAPHLVATEQGLFQVSPKNNVVVFVLDTTDTMQVQKSLSRDPSMALEFTGFTFFPDSVGSLIPTRFGVPYLLTGRMPQPQESFDDYYVNRFAESDFMKDIAQAGYDVGIYSDSLINGKPYIAPYASNIHDIQPSQALSSGAVDVWGTIGVMCQCALYRGLPWGLKPMFWFYTDWINTCMVDGMASPDHPEDVPYLIDDPAYAIKLRTRGLSVAENGQEGSFKFIHLLGSHPPYVMDAQGFKSVNGTTDVDTQTRGIFRVVGDYLHQLKELGLYEDATIIVTADHGVWLNSVEDAWWVSSPMMMVKPAGASDQAMNVSRAQTGHADFQATVLQAMGSNKASDYGTTVWEAPESGRTRYYCHLTHDMYAKIDYDLEEFRITGNVLDFANWQLDGNRWSLNRPN